jgi:phage terminase small subunit
MTGTLTPKQERFCLKYIETGNAAEAYRQSYNAENMKPVTIRRKAAELLDNGKVTARVRALQQRALERHDVTVDSITAELEEARIRGLKLNQVSAAVGASLGKAKIHGLLIEKNEHTGKDGGPIKTDATVQIYLPDNTRK